MNIYLLENGCIVEGEEVKDKQGRALPRRIIVKISYACKADRKCILEALKAKYEG
jgi:hypothetical protein